ncbi:EexN family lipoprotein [Burkholderia gladioli]|uniref:Putative lipoprotein n=1 Tax=Burkholderia gladioli (strain BSR3) TaxID=999541 RepID=F2LFG0_BURGS|nr:EexN family lipoprotein [Burkholderia gladioli]AEA61126.1 putative lipoprotein [Burkholderia gladioli BSR3]
MNKITLCTLIVALAACSKAPPPDTVESLAANPGRLKELRQQCKTDRAKLGDELCDRVAEATNRQFLGNGKVPYTPPKDAPKF